MGDASPGGKQVGKVSIRVVPDATKFREDLKEQLKKQGVKNVTIPVDGEVDDDQLVKDTAAAAKKSGKAASGEKIEYTAEVSLADKIQEQLKSINDNKALKVKFDDLVEFQKVGLAPGEVQTIRAKLAFDNLAAEQAKLKAALSNEKITISPRLDQTEIIKSRFRLFLTELQGVARNTPVRIDVEVDQNSMSRAAASLNRGLSRVGAGVSRGVGGLRRGLGAAVDGVASSVTAVAGGAAKAATSLLRMGDAFWILAAVIAVAAPALALVSGLLVALPAALVGFATPLAAIALGMDGIKKAAETAKPAFEELKKSVSDVFAVKLLPGFEQIRDRLIPGIVLPMEGLAETLSTMFNGVVDTLAGPEGLNNIQRIIDNVSAAVTAATPGVESFTAGFSNLIAKLSEGFPGVGDWFTNLGADFDAWVTKISSNGELDTAMETLKTSLGDIGGLVGDIAAWSWDNLSDPAFGEKLNGFTANLRTIVNELLPALKSGFEDLAEIVDGVAKAIRWVQEKKDQISEATDWKPIPDENLLDPGKLLGLEAPTADTGWIETLFGPLGAEVANKWFGVGEQSGAKFQEGMDQMLGGGGSFGVKPTDSIKTAVEGQLAQVDLAAQAEALQSVFQGQGMTDEIRNNINTQMQEIITSVVASLNTLGPQIDTALTNATTSLTKLPETISNEFTKSFQGLPGKIGTALASAPAAITGALAPVRGAVAESMAEAAAAANEGGALTAQVAAASFGTVPPAISGALQPCITTVATVCGQMVSTALSFAGAMNAAGVSVGASFAQGLASTTGLVAASAEAVMGAARAFFPNSPADEGPFSGKGWVTYSGEAVGEGFADGIGDSSKGVVSTTRELMQAVKDIFGDASGLTLNFNLGAAAMGSMAEDAQKFNSSMSSAATSLGSVKSSSGSTSLGKAAQIDTQSQAELDNLKWEQDRLSVMQDMLNLQTRGASEAQKNEIKRQTDLLGLQKDRLAMQGKELEYWSKYTDKSRDYNDAWSAVGDKAQGALTDFGKSVGQQAMSDLGIGGQGAIPQGVDAGINYVFQVLDVASGLAAQQTVQNKNSLQYQ